MIGIVGYSSGHWALHVHVVVVQEEFEPSQEADDSWHVFD